MLFIIDSIYIFIIILTFDLILFYKSQLKLYFQYYILSMSTIVKSISTDFGGQWSQSQLHQEIVAESAITTILVGINHETGSDTVNIVFESAPSGPELTALNALIAAHIPVDPPEILISTEGAVNTTATIRSTQTANRIITLPDATDELVGRVVSQTLANKKLNAASTEIADNADLTKVIKFDASTASSSSSLTIKSSHTGNRVINFPDTSDTLVGKDSSETLTNKTFKDASTVFEDNLDTSKQLKFLLDGSSPYTLTTVATTSSANRTITLPDVSGTLVTQNGTEILQNKSFTDAGCFFIDNSNNTKKMRFELSGVTTGNTRVMTVPDDDITIDGISNPSVLTNKTITSTTNNVAARSLHSTTTVINVSSATAPTSGQVLTATSSTSATWQDPAAPTETVGYYYACDAAGSGNVAANPVTVVFDTVKFNDSNWSLTNGELTALTSDSYLLIANIGTYGISGTSRSGTDAFLEVDTGSGFTEVADTRALMYNRGAGYGDDSCTISCPISATAGHKYRIRCVRSHGSDTMGLRPGASRITIIRIKGVKGDKGDAGPSGDIEWTGDWVSQNYLQNQAVYYEGSSYVCTINTTSNQIPTDTNFWDPLALKGEPGLPGSGVTINVLSDGASIGTYERINFNGMNVAQNGIDSTRVDIGLTLGISHYGPSAIDPVVTPSAGDKYFNTILNEEMFYDASRSKWLSIAVRSEGSGINGTANSGSFYRRFNGMTLSANLGPYVQKGTITYIGFSNANAGNHTYEIMINGNPVAELFSNGNSAASDSTLNADFDGGVLSSRNKAGSSTTSNLQGRIEYRLRI